MIAEKVKKYDPTRCSLKKLCEMVSNYSYSYDDLSELIEDKGYEECTQGKSVAVIDELARLTLFFERMEKKNEENIKDLVDIYVLTGEFCQYAERFKDSIAWFKKAIAVDGVSGVPFHSAATSYMYLGETEKAVQCLELEIGVEPGNYYTYLMLTDLYEKQEKYEQVEETLRNLLARDSDNIQALHRLICFYEKLNPRLDLELLRRRLIHANREFVKLDLIIWTYHMLREERNDEALKFLGERETESPGISLIPLLKAHIYGRMRQYVNKRGELTKFVRLNHGRREFMKTKLDEFEKVFGQKERLNLEKKLVVTKINSR